MTSLPLSTSRRRNPGRTRPVSLKARAARLSTNAALGVYCVSSIFAFVWTMSVSLKSSQEFVGTRPWTLPTSLQFSNYTEAWSRARIGTYFLNSLAVVVVSVLVAVVLGVLAAYAIARIDFRGRGLARTYFLLGLMVPGFLVIIPLYSLLRDLNLLGSMTGLALVYVAITIPLNVFLMTGFFEGLPMELEEAASVDGASPLRTLFSVMLPLARPGIVSVAVLNALTLWNEFFFALILLGDESKFTIPIGLLGLSVSAAYDANYPVVFAGMVISMVPMLIMFAIAQRTIEKSIIAGAIKG